MSDVSDRCPQGHAPDLATRLAWDGSSDDADWLALESCAVCARAYAIDVWVATALRRHRDAPGEAVPPLRAPKQSTSVRRAVRWAVAASLLIAASAGAAATVWFAGRPSFLTNSNGTLGRAAEVELSTGLDFGAADITAESPVAALCGFMLDGAVGRAALVQVGRDRKVDVAGFDSHGALRWSARRHWRDWGRLLDEQAVEPVGLFNLVTRGGTGALEETLCVALHRYQVGAILTVDPRTGAHLGTLLHPGPLAMRGEGLETIATLPAADGKQRLLIVCGQHREDGRVIACATVFRVNGEVVQHVVFPPPRELGVPESRMREVHVNWAPDAPSALFVDDAGLLFEMPVREGRLVPGETECSASDAFLSHYDALNGPEASRSPEHVERIRRGTRNCKSQVRDEPLTRRDGWRR